MNTYPLLPVIHQTGLNAIIPAKEVYREQVRLLYQQLPFGFLTVLLIAPVFGYIVWVREQTYPVIIWLTLMFLLAAIQIWSRWKFNRISLEKIHIRHWEIFFFISIGLSAFLWGATSLWLDGQSNNLQHLFHVFTLTGLVGGSIAHLSSRPAAFRIFTILILFPYIIRYLVIDTQHHLAIAGLISLYMIVMLLTSIRIHSVITESLQLRYKNIELLKSYEATNQHNQKANKALFEIMQLNKNKELALEKSETFLRSILITANDGIITSDSKGIILAVNHAIERDFGYTKEELLGNSINLIMSNDTSHKHDHYISQYLNSDAPILVGRMLDVMAKRKDGSLFPAEITVSEARIDNEIFFTGIIRDITDRKDHEKIIHDIMRELAHAKMELENTNSLLQDKNRELTELSEHDVLTGLANRRFLFNALKREWSMHRRNNKQISIILLDIDFFKRFNDKFGHQAGDDCLKQVAEVLENNIARPADFIARYGGEEFIVVLPETDLAGAYHIAEKMRLTVEELRIRHDGSEIPDHVTISGGVTTIIPNQGNSYKYLIKQADKALYEAKHNGRNCIRTR